MISIPLPIGLTVDFSGKAIKADYRLRFKRKGGTAGMDNLEVLSALNQVQDDLNQQKSEKTATTFVTFIPITVQHPAKA